MKSCNPFEKLRLLRDDKFPMGVLEKKRFREGFCELCRLPGQIYKQCYTYPEEAVSDRKCVLCEGRHGASPCYFETEQVPRIP